MSCLLSASRRTDVPAFYMDWFMKRLREQYLFVKHPYTGGYFHVSLKPENLLGIVFWSKDFSPLLSRLDEIEKVTHNLFFHFTITDLPEDIEANTPPFQEVVKDFIFLAERYSPDCVIWRFDPLCITDKISFGYHKEAFRQCMEMLKGHCHTCYISFVNPYYKVIKNFERYTSHRLLDIPVEEKRSYAKRLAEVAARYGIRMYACCNDYLLSDESNPPLPLFKNTPLTPLDRGDDRPLNPLLIEGNSPPLEKGLGSRCCEALQREVGGFSDKIQKASCINLNNLSRVWGLEGIDYEKPSPTRKECACTKSIDIGAYDTCPHGCIYCYANTDKEKAVAFHSAFNPDWNALDTNIDVEEYSTAI
ncbi:MAG: DUF1848 domain-containing protein [Nitrospirae bacterium]|nr:DUF1848 domain-containing protein [Nitrospirota bacterium]